MQGPEPGDEEVRAAAAAADSEVQLLLTSCQLSQLSQLSQASLESDGFYSDLVFSETPSPVQGATRQTDTVKMIRQTNTSVTLRPGRPARSEPGEIRGYR